MTIVRALLFGLILLLVAAETDADTNAAKILVTFDDPGMSNAARAGPVRPGYRRPSSTYLVSIDVRRAARRIEREFGLRRLDEWPIDPLKVHCIVYAVEADANVNDLIAQLREQPGVESAQRMNTFDVLASASAGPSDPYYDLQHNMDRLELAAAHRWSRGQGSSVTIIDTGADLQHPELRLRSVSHEDFVDEGGSEFHSDAHGTAVAGIIGASSDNGIGIVGVAPSASMSVLRACWYVDGRVSAVCDSFTLAKALSFAIDSRTNVINLSLTGPGDPLLARLVERALAQGKIVVAAASATADRDQFPASVAGVMVVDAAGSGKSKRLDDRVYAPGDDILVPVPGGGFDYASGTSLSAAHVSGVVALLVSKQPELTHRDVAELFAADKSSSDGSISACRALAALLNVKGCAPAVRAADRVH